MNVYPSSFVAVNGLGYNPHLNSASRTTFQEACATAHDVKAAVSGARYYLVCDWLDMTPLSTAPTDVNEILLLRKAKRINSNVRSKRLSSNSGWGVVANDLGPQSHIKLFHDRLIGLLHDELVAGLGVLAEQFLERRVSFKVVVDLHF